jgi:hypothetical protein
MEGGKRPKKWLRFIGFTLGALFFMALGAGVTLRHEYLEQQALYAVVRGDRAEVERLLAAGVHVNSDPWSEDLGMWLLRRILTPESQPFMSQKLVSAATFKGDLPLVRLLLDNGARLDLGPTHKRPIYIAAWNNDAKMFRFLLDRGAIPDIVYKDGSMPWDDGSHQEIKVEYDFWQMKQKAKRGS